jgi:hypothetical protein
LTYDTVVDGQTVTTTIDIPAGAVPSDTTFVFQHLNSASEPLLAKNSLISAFTFDAYVDGVLQSNFHFTAPVHLTIGYVPVHVKESSIQAYGWNGSAWSQAGIQDLSVDPVANQVTFSLTDLKASEFILMGETQYTLYLSIIHK